MSRSHSEEDEYDSDESGLAYGSSSDEDDYESNEASEEVEDDGEEPEVKAGNEEDADEGEDAGEDTDEEAEEDEEACETCVTGAAVADAIVPPSPEEDDMAIIPLPSRGKARYHVGRYTTLRERIEGKALEIAVGITLFPLALRVIRFLDTLVNAPGVRLSLPRWKDQETTTAKKSDPMGYYTLRVYGDARRYKEKGAPLFFEGYDPITITYTSDLHKRGDDADRIVGIVYDGIIFARNAEHGKFVDDELNYLVQDVEAYFSDMGKRWGKCLICRHPLSAAKSLERSIGQVCYGRLTKMQAAAYGIDKDGKKKRKSKKTKEEEAAKPAFRHHVDDHLLYDKADKLDGGLVTLYAIEEERDQAARDALINKYGILASRVSPRISMYHLLNPSERAGKEALSSKLDAYTSLGIAPILGKRSTTYTRHYSDEKSEWVDIGIPYRLAAIEVRSSKPVQVMPLAPTGIVQYALAHVDKDDKALASKFTKKGDVWSTPDTAYGGKSLGNIFQLKPPPHVAEATFVFPAAPKPTATAARGRSRSPVASKTVAPAAAEAVPVPIATTTASRARAVARSRSPAGAIVPPGAVVSSTDPKVWVARTPDGFHAAVPYIKRFMVKQIQGTTWDPDGKYWVVPLDREQELADVMASMDVDHLPAGGFRR